MDAWNYLETKSICEPENGISNISSNAIILQHCYERQVYKFQLEDPVHFGICAAVLDWFCKLEKNLTCLLTVPNWPPKLHGWKMVSAFGKMILGFFLLCLLNVNSSAGRCLNQVHIAGIFGLGETRNEESQRNKLQSTPIEWQGSQQGRSEILSSQGENQNRQAIPHNDPSGRPVSSQPYARQSDLRYHAQQHQTRNFQQGQSPPRRPPPPPPPPLPDKGEKESNADRRGEHEDENDQQNATAESGAVPSQTNETQRDEYSGGLKNGRSDSSSESPHPPEWDTNYYHQQAPSNDPQNWMGPPPPEYNGWGVAPQQFPGWVPQQTSQYYDNPMMLHDQLDEALAREYELLAQLENLTASMAVLNQREELHTRQLDVLTERVMDVEAQAAADRSSALEFEANCTVLGKTVAKLQGELDEWQKRCSELTDQHDEDEQKISELRREIKAKALEAEELAIAMENFRLSEKVKTESSSRRIKKKGGFFSWLFGLFLSSNDEYEEFTREVSALTVKHC